jgi:hypothetical protein
MTNDNSKEILKELVQIKRLLMAHMLKSGAEGKDLAHALDISTGRISQMFPVKKFNKYK